MLFKNANLTIFMSLYYALSDVFIQLRLGLFLVACDNFHRSGSRHCHLNFDSMLQPLVKVKLRNGVFYCDDSNGLLNILYCRRLMRNSFFQAY